ncbi:MAG: ATP-grasp domain-containing protein [Methylophilaceae bacterium]|nr:ATP-grasp domain-containing protein [Methylophilaceae bacterium]
MLRALLTDLLALPGVEVITTRDARLHPLELPVRVVPIEGDPWACWQQCIQAADALWPIAPESRGILERLALLAQDRILLGCAPEAIRMTSSKHATARYLSHHGIDVVSTFRPAEFLPSDGPHVAKPDDGVGCEDSMLFDDVTAMLAWLAQGRRQSHVIQPWLRGEAASLSMLCRDGEAWLLSCNRQLIEIRDGALHYGGSRINDMVEHWRKGEEVSRRIAAALPGLRGYVGVDVIIEAGRLTVLEINPRLTTSYVGLQRAIGYNPAGLVLDLLYNGRMTKLAKLERNPVEVILDG